MTSPANCSVLFVSSITLDPDNQQQAKQWSEMSKRFHPHVICFSNTNFGSEQRYGCIFYCLPKIPFLWLRVTFYYLLVPFLISYLSVVNKIRTWSAQGPFEAGAAFLPRLLLGNFCRVRLIIEAHGDWVESFPTLHNLPFPSMVKRFIRVYSRIVLGTADGLRSVSRKTRAMLERWGPEGVPHRTFPGFSTLDLFLKTTRAEKMKNEQDHVAYVGALTKLKGIDRLIEALARQKQSGKTIALKLFGDGRDRQTFENLVAEKGLTESITFEGTVPPDILREEYVKARLVVLPSQTEGLPRVLLESLACRTPFVATDTPGAEEIAEKSGGGRVVPVDNHHALGTHITELFENKSLRRKLGENGRKYVEDEHGTKKYFEKFQNLVSEVSR